MATKPATTVAVTRVGGALGRRLVQALDADAAVDRILGFDLAAPAGLTSPKLAFEVVDAREVDLGSALDGVDVFVHLGFEPPAPHDEAALHLLDVEGTRRILTDAVDAGAKKLIHLSSGMVYGAHPDNDLPLAEDSPLRANLQFSFAEHRLEVEEWLWPWAAERPDTVVTALRPSIVGGQGLDHFLSRQLEAPRFPVVKGHKPPLQFVHVDDLVAAVTHAIGQDLPGAYNVSAEGWLSFDEVTALLDRPVLELPEEVAFSVTDRLWELGIGYAPPGQLHHLMHPWVLAVDRLRATGWRPQHSNRDAFAALLADHEDWLRLPGMRVRRSMLRGGVAIGGLVVAGALVALRIRRRAAGAP